MTRVGRIHQISSAAEGSAQKILNGILKQYVVYKGRRRPLCSEIEFQTTWEERRYLAEIAQAYNSKQPTENHLIAHGTLDVYHLSQILTDRELRHVKEIENYGDLGVLERNQQLGGYLDHGWGVFVARPQTIKKAEERSEKEQYLTVPLEDLDAILLPTPLVSIVQDNFPIHANVIKGYEQFAEEIRSEPKPAASSATLVARVVCTAGGLFHAAKFLGGRDSIPPFTEHIGDFSLVAAPIIYASNISDRAARYTTAFTTAYFALGESLLPQILPGTADPLDIPAILVAGLGTYYGFRKR